MYSSINKNKDYQLISKRPAAWEIIKNLSIKRYFFIRHPRKKLESFYKDKLIKNLPEKINDYQYCQKIMYQYILTDETLPDSLQEISYKQFIYFLPYVYMRDLHLTPQYLSCSVFNIYMGSLFRLVNIDDLANKILIDTLLRSEKINTTQKKTFEYTESMEETIKSLYKKDYKYFKAIL